MVLSLEGASFQHYFRGEGECHAWVIATITKNAGHLYVN